MIDLHTHTTRSDGADEPATLLARARDIGLTTLSITDHNTVAAYRDPCMGRLDELFPGTLLRGVEITCLHQGEIVEVLGYCFDLDAMESLLADMVLPFEEKQLRESRLIATALRNAGACFDEDAISFDPSRESSRKAYWRELLRHPENRVLATLDESWGSSRAFTRNEVYNPKSRLFVDESSLYPSLGDAVDLIHEARGVAQLAHLHEYASADELRSCLWETVGRIGLDGVECAHSCFDEAQTVDLEEFDRSHGLVMSGGSDYHGSRKRGIELGRGRGNMCVPEDYLETWPSDALERGEVREKPSVSPSPGLTCCREEG